MGKANLDKAESFENERNFVQALRYAEIAATKLKQQKDRRLETVKLIDKALACKFDALGLMCRYKEAMVCAEERYTLWAMNQMRNPGSIHAALRLIQSCIHNKRYEDAESYARHAMFMINEMADNFIPAEQQSQFLADGSYYLAEAILKLTVAGGIPPEEKQKAGEEAITLARQALEIHTQLHGTESDEVASDMQSLAGILDHFNNVDDDEILRLHEQAIAIISRVQGNPSYNVATGENQLGYSYGNRSHKAYAANDLDRCMANFELSLPHHREAVRIFRVINDVDNADKVLRTVTKVEERIRMLRILMTETAELAAAEAAAAAAVSRA